MYYNLSCDNNEEIRIISLNNYGGIGEVRGRKVYLTGDFKDIKLGDRLLAKIELNKDINVERGILGEVKIEDYKKLNTDLKGKIYRIREYIFNNLKEKLGSRRAALITSISFGYTEFLDREDESTMKNLGVLHAVSVSGLHMVLVYSLLKKILGNKIAPIVAVIYVIFTGAAISTVRSYIMLLCLSLAIPFRRSYNPLAGLSLAGIILILYKPYSIFEVGFQLSFLSTLGIILFNKKFNKDLYRLPKILREGTAISLSSQVFTFPFLVLYFREFSLGFLAGNIILMPLINAVVILGNILALTINFKIIFNYIVFISYYVTLAIDIISEKLLNILPSILFLNEIIAISYIIMLITIYFYRRGYKNSIYFPTLIIFYLFIIFYSPYPKFEYYKDGILLISYKGERSLIAIKESADLNKYKYILLSNSEYKSFKKIKLNNSIEIEKINKNILIRNSINRYLIKLSSGKFDGNYDIIDCKHSNYVKIILLKNKVLVTN
ncbi:MULTISPECIES: ComEC/Rec2 family competence protein [unclassified Clostridium]|uniref:ComEC/Rec2 family competence protein n=1 Tax=unclassified Clostridium TaxID=2614128 RepID=UPI0025C1CE36|nr:ComEC/Rec2 family competence protein [Clostridium sp.]MCI6693493.1 ComEC/Rec2 family competence protein [Clostridium sp.]MDY2632307.1 ComEC/Rec2 family competence protein [Clostridium sp.]MDY4252935.1 ComEC/Rec2 family competence protein [Clostridium sp.]MDY6226632.1 ComEC/Rec2 family competence protein [Clostridium sp.]